MAATNVQERRALLDQAFADAEQALADAGVQLQAARVLAYQFADAVTVSDAMGIWDALKGSARARLEEQN